MKKFTKVLAMAVIAVVTVVLLTACGSDDHELVGTWRWDDNPAFTYVFNNDGTGTRGGSPDVPVTNIEWRVSGNVLYIECPNAIFGVHSEEWYWTIEGRTLTLVSRQAVNLSFTYTRR